MKNNLLFFILNFFCVYLNAQNDKDPLSFKNCLLFNSAFSDSAFEVKVYTNAFSLYYNPKDSNQCAAIKKSGLREYKLGELLQKKDTVLGKIVYISPDSVKIINRLFPIKGNYFTSPLTNGILTSMVYISFNEEVSDSVSKIFLKQNNIADCRPETGSYKCYGKRFLYLHGDKVLAATLKVSQSKLVKKIVNIVTDGRRIRISDRPPQAVLPFNSTDTISKKILNGHTFLFCKSTVTPSIVNLGIYRVSETDSTVADTIFVLEETLVYKSNFEMIYDRTATLYETKDNHLYFYKYDYNFDQLFGVPDKEQNPILITTSKTEYFIQANGECKLISAKYGRQGKKIINAALHTYLMKCLKKQIDFVESRPY
ncbi:MAG: hypothetical protein IAF38_00390 [Bacteroidia bacterium]|nr:hypothetical protein [Bacteroidia bacterium]